MEREYGFNLNCAAVGSRSLRTPTESNALRLSLRGTSNAYARHHAIAIQSAAASAMKWEVRIALSSSGSTVLVNVGMPFRDFLFYVPIFRGR